LTIADVKFANALMKTDEESFHKINKQLRVPLRLPPRPSAFKLKTSLIQTLHHRRQKLANLIKFPAIL
jgi:hypothetical protein